MPMKSRVNNFCIMVHLLSLLDELSLFVVIELDERVAQDTCIHGCMV